MLPSKKSKRGWDEIDAALAAARFRDRVFGIAMIVIPVISIYFYHANVGELFIPAMFIAAGAGLIYTSK